MLKIVLEETLEWVGITRNYLAVEGKIRPATLHEMVNQKVQRLDLDTLHKILVTLNRISKEKGLGTIELTDVIKYIPEE